MQITTSERGHTQHAHANEWGRFTIHARTHHIAARAAAELGWWLHAWAWEESDIDGITITENTPPAPHITWAEYLNTRAH